MNADHVAEFLRDGVLVVENFLSPEELDRYRCGLTHTLARRGVDVTRLDECAEALAALSSTNGSGGVLDVFYEDWKMELSTNRKLFELTSRLWEAAFCHHGEGKDEVSEAHRWHPYGSFDPKKGYAYIDRIGYRLPTDLSELLGEKISSGETKKKKRAIQRSLTPHLDCCPNDLFAESNAKWRPIQCFISLTDNLNSNTGGFEAARGFHREFDEWARTRPLSTFSKKERDGTKSTVSLPAPCIGEYTHIRPAQDKDAMDRVCHVAVPAGSAVFWDYRIPHANAYRHDGDEPRAVAYVSFLPDVPLNREYARKQLKKYESGVAPSDQWVRQDGEERKGRDLQYELSPLGRKLMAIDEW